MGIVESFSSCLTKYFMFNGRAVRSELWWFMLSTQLVTLLAFMLNFAIGNIIAWLFIIPILAVGSRRLHDVGRSGWWQLICLIPIAGILVLIYWFVQPSEAQDNQYNI